MPHKSPKVLLVTETPPGTPNGFGVTLKALFKEIEHNVLYTDASFNNHGEKNGFLFGHVPYHRSKKAFFKFISGIIPEWSGIFSILWLKKSIKENFDLVYAFFYSLSCLRFASWIAEKKGLPLIAHLADHSDEFHNSEASRILKSAGRFVCITKDMRDKYELMLGRKDIEVLHNGAENECFEIPSPQNLCFSENNPFRLTFIGGLFEYLHGDCIEDFFLCFSKLKSAFPFLEIHLYGQRQPTDFLSEFLSIDGVTHHGILMPLEKKFEIMRSAHCFMIPSSFSLNNHAHYRFSFPTKLPELLCTGRPILSYGPAETATNRILADLELGVQVNHRSQVDLANAIKEIILNYPKYLYSSSDSGFLSKIKPYTARKMRSKLSKVLKID